MKIVSASLVTLIKDIDPTSLMYENGQMLGLSLCTIYKLLAIRIQIYKFTGSNMHQKVLFVISDHYVTSLCGTEITLGMLIPISLVLGSDLRKLQLQSFCLISDIVCVSDVVASDEKLLHFTGMTLYRLL